MRNMRTIIYKIKNDLSLMGNDADRMNYINELGSELQRIAGNISSKHQFEFIEPIQEEENVNVPVCS